MSLSICSISSGSKGNCYLIKSERVNVLLDAGISGTRIKTELKELNEAVPSTILVSHLHSDHVKGIDNAMFSEADVYCGENSLNELQRTMKRAKNVRFHPVRSGLDFFIGDITVCPMTVSHDVPCLSYSLISEGKKISVLTDLGHVTGEMLDSIMDSDLVVIESNYDEGMLSLNQRYPEMLKIRISGRGGHLSNSQCARAVVQLAEAGVKRFMLAHLSENNNTPKLARDSILSALHGAGLDGVEVYVATQAKRSDVIQA